MKNNCIVILLGCIFFLQSEVHAQFYGDVGLVGTAEIDLCDCSVGDPVPNEGFGGSSLAVAPNGNTYSTIDFDVYYYDFATGTNVFVATMPGEPVGLVYGADGLLYTTITTGVSPDQLITINPISGAITILGSMPLNWTMSGDLWFYNGGLYGLFYDLTAPEVLFMAFIDIANPTNSYILYSFSGWAATVAGVSVFINGVETVLVQGINTDPFVEGVYSFDMNTGTQTLLCPGLVMADSGAPPGYIVPPCCSNEAGSFASLNLVTACVNQSISPDHIGDEILNPGASLSFVLLSDSTGNLPDDILQISANPTFSFDPATMVLNQVYFVAAVAAPGSPGNPNWPAGCTDVSFFTPVEWVALPTVNFSVANPEVCAGDCLTFNVSLTGTPPFSLTYSSNVSGQETEVFTTTTGIIEICPPAGTPQGVSELSAVSLADANCVCD